MQPFYKPVIWSLLDLDFYKLTMAQLAFFRHRDVLVTYAFKNRTKRVKLPEFVTATQLQDEFEHVRTLRLTQAELGYLRSCRHLPVGFFREEFLKFFAQLQLPPVDVRIVDGEFEITVTGKWPEAIFWETMILGVVNEFYFREQVKRSKASLQDVWAEGDRRLDEKIRALKANPEIRFSEFGTRRRFSYDWQEHVLSRLDQELPEGQLLGTSNVALARHLDLPPNGTQAHEMDMVYSGIYDTGDDDSVRHSHQTMLKDWFSFYGEQLSIALTDTYGTDFFFQDFTQVQAREWRGLRQDSGDPLEFGEKALEFYRLKGVDPLAKTAIFSDGLDIAMIQKIERHFRGRIKVRFGWGTNLTNDLGFDPLSLVVKAVRANGHTLVKLSDNLAKATGKPEDVKRFKQIFGYVNEASTATVY